MTRPDEITPQRQAQLEDFYEACWACITAGAHHVCQHYAERAGPQRGGLQRVAPILPPRPKEK